MPTSTYITLVIIYTLEAVLIVFGNALPIFVFWTERSRLKRTYFLLINLAVADLLVGITEFIIIGTAKSHNVGEGYGFLMRSRANLIAAFILLFSGTSVYFLALISMERGDFVFACHLTKHVIVQFVISKNHHSLQWKDFIHGGFPLAFCQSFLNFFSWSPITGNRLRSSIKGDWTGC